MSLESDAVVRKLLKRTTPNQHKKDSSGYGDGQEEQQALLIQLCRESMNKGTSSVPISAIWPS